MEKELLKILLVDDDESDRLLFEEAFSELKIKTEVQPLNDGEQLMDWLHTDGIRLPDFIFLDLNMPRKNGITCLKEIRADASLKHIFIAIYSTSDSEKDMEETFQQGANVYITKPNSFNALKLLLYKSVTATLVYEGDTFNRDNFLLRL